MAVQCLRFHLLMQRPHVPSLSGEPRFHMPGGKKTKTQNRNNIVTNSIETFKMVQARYNFIRQMKLGNSTEKYLGGCSCYEEGGQRKLLEYAGLLAEI